jgi:hypothetical protein
LTVCAIPTELRTFLINSYRNPLASRERVLGEGEFPSLWLSPARGEIITVIYSVNYRASSWGYRRWRFKRFA